MRVFAAVLISVLVGCTERPTGITFGAPTPLTQLETTSIHAVDLALTIGVGDDVEAQHQNEDGRTRVRVERADDGATLRILEWKNSNLEGRGVKVTSTNVITIDDEQPVTTETALFARSLTQPLAGPDALQVELMRVPTFLNRRVARLEHTFAALARQSLGQNVEVRSATVQLTGATESVAVFTTTLEATTTSGPVQMDYALTGTLEVRRADTFILGFSLEGPVTVETPGATTEEPSVRGTGTLVLSRRMRPLSPAEPQVVSALP